MAMVGRSSTSDLPEELEEEILKRLPLECLCRCRSVCQQWNTLFTSTSFITTQWANFPSNKRLCLVLCGLNSLDPQNRCWTYCFYTRMWKSSFPLSFLEGMRSDGYRQGMFCDTYCRGSAAGLLLVDIWYSDIDTQKLLTLNPVVCNPVTGRSETLASSPSNRRTYKGIVAGDFDGNRQTYKVVAVSDVFNPMDEQVAPPQNVEIYDSAKKFWSVARCIPHNVSINGDRMVFSKEYFYCKATCYSGKQDIVGRRGIVGASLQNDSFIFVPLPGLPNHNMCHHLVACRSRVFLARCVLEDDQEILNDVHIWELVNVKVDSNISPSWMEIARIPQSMCDEIRRIWPRERSFEFVGVEDFVCFIGCTSMNVAVYSLTDNLWSWLPSCPFQNHERLSDPTWIFSFEPRPDMKVI